MERLLVTGAAGNMGRLLRPRLRRDGRVLRLLDVVPIDGSDAEPPDTAAHADELVLADVTDADAMAAACEGVDAVLHLGGISVEAPFDDILRVNIVGTANLLEAARQAGVTRVVLASSNHAAGFYRRSDVPEDGDGLPGDLPALPDTFYGWSKAAIESLGALYHHRFGMDVMAIRIGTCFAEPFNVRALATWLSPDDAARLVEACLAADAPGFRVMWGVSDNTRRWWSLAEAVALGYESHDDAEVFAARYLAGQGEPDLTDPVHDLVGGQFCEVPLGRHMHG